MRKFLPSGYEIQIQKIYTDVSTYDDIWQPEGDIAMAPDPCQMAAHVNDEKQAIEAIKKYFREVKNGN